jgi:intracellular multiplication protein IcmN
LRTLCGLLLLCWGLWGCSSSRTFDDDPLPTSVEGTSDSDIEEKQDTLTSDKVQIISIGDDYMLSIPSSQIFANESPKITKKGRDVLDDVVDYLQSMRKIAVHVSAYADCYQSQARTQALTKARAKVVGAYLWSHNVESKMIFTEGFGSDKPIVLRTTGDDKSPNSRVEITFRQVLS